MEDLKEKQTITAKEYFDDLKTKRQQVTNQYLKEFYAILDEQVEKAYVTKQDYLLRRLFFMTSLVEKEYKLLELGIDTFVLREDIEKFINLPENKEVKVVEMAQYPRVIPDEFIPIIDKLKQDNIFDAFYIVFTDYTGEAQQAVEKERREKDPILFATWQHKLNGIWDLHDRFYYIGDWEDEYCDLTLSKMVSVMAKKQKQRIDQKIEIPKADKQAITDYVNSLKENERGFNRLPKKNVIDKIKYVVNIAIKEFKS